MLVDGEVFRLAVLAERRVQAEFLFAPRPEGATEGPCVPVGAARIPLEFVSHRRARRYILRLTPKGAARVTIPRGGSTAEGLRFAESQAAWLEVQLHRAQERSLRPQGWFVGSEVLFRGARVVLTPTTADDGLAICLAGHSVPLAHPAGDLRPALERWLWSLAKGELPPRVHALACQHGLAVRAVVVRNQRSRWGSCSRRGTLSLNWRLVQTPDFVRDYIILHELMHLREMNHSSRFWQAVERVCPQYREAERWLRGHAEILRSGAGRNR